jgi:hypothetical protein
MKRKKTYSVIALFIFTILFISSGLINIHHFQKMAVVAVEQELTEHFMRQGEQIEEFLTADYSLEHIEIGIKTHRDSHYVVARVTNSFWETYTGLNLFIKPRIEIVNIYKEKIKT